MIWNFWTMKQRSFEFFWKFSRKSALLLKFRQMSVNFADTSKMYCCGLFLWKWKFHRLVIFRLQIVEYASPFFRYDIFSVFHENFVKKFMKSYPFSARNSKCISRCSILEKIKMSDFVILKWRPFIR